MEFKNPLAGQHSYATTPPNTSWGSAAWRWSGSGAALALNPDEAAFIALHIVNAELNTSMSEMYDITRLIEGVVEVVEYFYRDLGRF